MNDKITGNPLFAKRGSRTLPEKLYILVSCVIGTVVRLIYALTRVGPSMKRRTRLIGSRKIPKYLTGRLNRPLGALSCERGVGKWKNPYQT